MQTSTVEIGGLLSPLGAEGVKKLLQTLPGVHHVDVNYVAGSATVHYDEGRATLSQMQEKILQCGYHCRGELVPRHVCDRPAAPSTRTTAPHAQHAHHPHAGAATADANVPGATQRDTPPPAAMRMPATRCRRCSTT